jgi:hypothetical protein
MKAVEMAECGVFRTTIARALNVSPRTFQRWLALGRKFPEGIYGLLLQGLTTAEGEFEAQAVIDIRKAGAEDARHLEWLLERKYPQRWGRFRGELGELNRRLRELEALLGIGREPPPNDDDDADGKPSPSPKPFNGPPGR